MDTRQDLLVCSGTYVWDQLKTLVISIHWIIHSRMKFFNERADIFCIVESVVRSCWKGLHSQIFRAIGMKKIIHTTRISSHNFSVFIIWWCLMVCWSMEPFKEKKCVMVWPWWNIESDSNRAVNKIYETFFVMRLGVHIRKLHVWSCVYHVKFIAEINLMESGDQGFKRPSLGVDTLCQYYFNFCLVILI